MLPSSSVNVKSDFPCIHFRLSSTHIRRKQEKEIFVILTMTYFLSILNDIESLEMRHEIQKKWIYGQRVGTWRL